MKTTLKLLLTSLPVLLLLTQTKVAAAGIEFHHGSLAEAQQKASRSGKLIFLDAYAEWCGPCKWMAANTFTDQRVGAFFNDNFINVKMDMERGEGPEWSRKFRIEAYPTLIFLNANGEVVMKETGARDASGLMALGQKVLGGKATPTEDIRADDQEASAGEEEDMDPLFLAIGDAVESGEEEAYETAMADLMQSDREDKNFVYIEAMLYWEESNGQIADFLTQTKAFIENVAPQDPELILFAAAYLYGYAETDETVETARDWTASVLDDLPTSYAYYLFGGIQYYLGETDAAIEAMETALAYAKEEGEDTTELEEELEMMRKGE